MEKTPFHIFSDKLQTACSLIIITLFVLIATMILPNKKTAFYIIFGKLFALCLLIYVILSIYTNTTNFIKAVPDIFENSDLSGLRNNALLSYIVSLLLVFLGLYVIYSFFF
tara:strand:- start:390 stop:722 length:333 start_codon:yes stop_codon:yes gene_type:complete